jgi:ABC-type transport system involved in cytochrome c biogenesis permease component
VCIDFKILPVKVPIIIFGTSVFSARRDGHHSRPLKVVIDLIEGKTVLTRDCIWAHFKILHKK